ncbi:MAG: hemolysin family protein [Gemmatirosa sp.]
MNAPASYTPAISRIDESGIASEIVIILLLLVLNGVFAMSELAVMTARKIRLEQRAEAGDRGARAALELAHEPTQFLSTVQVGITLIGVLAGAFGGASIAEQLADGFRASATLAPYADALGLTIVVGAITYLSLIIGELVPKRVALTAPERIASVIARPMRVLSRVVSPLVTLLTGSTNLVLRLLGVRARTDANVTEEEIRALVEQGAESGALQREEHQVVERVFRLGDRQVSALMTPRPDVDWIDVGEGAAGLRTELALGRRSLLLVCREDVDHVVGFVHAEDLLARCVTGAPLDSEALESLAQPPLFVPESIPAFRLLDALRRGRQHAAVVLDEFGGVAGVVTLDDVLQDLVGDFPSDAGDDTGDDASIVRREDGSWLVDGHTPIADLETALDITLTEEERPGYQTVGGFVMARLGRLPRPAEHFEWEGHRFEVVDMDGRRVETVRVARVRHGDAVPGHDGGDPTPPSAA